MQAKFLIGIYGQLDQAKFEREWRPWFTGVEITSLTSWEEAERTVSFIKERGLEFGIHFPLVRDRYEEYPLVSSLDCDEQARSIHVVQTALQEAMDLGAHYLLIHFPKPAILESGLDWSDWRFVYAGEAISDEHLDQQEVERSAMLAFAQLEDLSRVTGVQLVLEMDILHAWFHGELIKQLYESHPGLGLCLDTGRLHLQKATDPALDIVGFAQSLTPWLTNLHLWTVKVGQNKAGGHHPLLPKLQTEEGWGPMLELLKAFASAREAAVLFEHRSELVSSEDLERCYQWVATTLCTE